MNKKQPVQKQDVDGIRIVLESILKVLKIINEKLDDKDSGSGPRLSGTGLRS